MTDVTNVIAGEKARIRHAENHYCPTPRACLYEKPTQQKITTCASYRLTTPIQAKNLRATLF